MISSTGRFADAMNEPARPLRVGIDLTALGYSHRTRGVGVYCENLIAALSATDERTAYTLFITPGAADPALERLPPNFSCEVLPAPPLGRGAPLVTHQWRLPRRARALALDVLHCPSLSAHASLPSVPFWQSVPTVVTVHDLTPLVLGTPLLRHVRHRRFYEFQLAACRRAAHLIAVSQHTARDLVRYGIAREHALTVIPNGVPPAVHAAPLSSLAAPGLAAQSFLLHVGGADPQKNQGAVLRAFGALCADPGFKHSLVLVGGHHLDDSPATRVSPRAAGRIARLGPLTRAELQALYENCALLLFPSLYEGFGLPVLEAMQAGAPVITSNTSSLPEVAGDAARLIDPHDPQALACAVRQLLEDPALRERYRAAGRARVREFSWTRAAELTREVYEETGQVRRLDEGART